MERTKELDKHWADNYWCETCQFYTGQSEFHQGHDLIYLFPKDFFQLTIAMEWGYRAHEKGYNLEGASIRFREIMKGESK